MIEAVSDKNLHDVLPLIRAYQQFYEIEDICDANNARFFSQFHKNSPLGCQFVFKQDGAAAGFATVYFSYASSITAKVAVLNDLYTVSEYRGNGIARKLIDHCRRYAKKQNAVRLQWVTAPDNVKAKRLYDSMQTSQSTWDFYTYSS